MRRRAKAAKARVAGKGRSARKSPKTDAAPVRDLEKRLAEARQREAEAFKRESEALEQQTATAEILRVISSFPSDYQPVFDTIVRSAGVVCGAADAILWIVDGDELVVHAHHGPLPARIGARQPIRGSVAGYAVQEARVIHIENVTRADDFPVGRDVARRLGWRTVLSAPLLRGGLPTGAILIRRREVRPFTESQIKLLQTFADQAVIAIENVRLFRELQGRNRDLTDANARVTEALEQQTATAEILKVISRSQTDVQPVFDTIVRSAVALCHGLFSTLFRFDGDVLRILATHNLAPGGLEALHRAYPAHPTRALAAGRAILDRAVIHIPDVELDPEVQQRALARAVGWRSALIVPMLREGAPIGVITVGRTEPGLFSESQIELLETFADQAVIAIENVRLFKELEARNRDLSEALEQQTATSEILRVISSSPTDEKPVFDAIARSSIRLCGAAFSVVAILDADEMLRLVASEHVGTEGRQSLAAAYPMRPNRGQLAGRATLDRAVVHVPDVTLDPEYVGAALGNRATLSVPMLRQGIPIGTITIGRFEPLPFSDQQIALLQAFADQAVIAIENVRLFKELEAKNRELTTTLDQQTATSEILRSISSSLTDVQPVFDTIVRSSVRLLDGFSATMTLLRDEQLELVAYTSTGAEGDALLRRLFPMPLRGMPPGEQAVRDRRTYAMEDVETATNVSDSMRETIRARGWRSALFVPMLREDVVVGLINITRRHPGPFASDEVALLDTFADQAVIAIENVRLFKELEARNADLTEALDRQTATAEILRVISQSQTEVQPVFDAIVDNAIRLFRGWAVAVMRSDGQLLHLVAARGGMPGTEEYLRRQSPWPIQGLLPASRCVAHRTLIHIPDAESDPTLDQGLRDLARTRGWRSVLAAPLLRDGQPIGAITVTRAEAGPFSSAEVELLQTFADQAVIAIENARLLGELQARTGELTRSVGQLTALGEVGRAVSSTLDLETVLTTIVSRAVELSGLDGGVVFEYEEGTEEFVHRAATETGGTLAQARRTTRVPRGEGVVGQTAITLEPAQVPDITVPGAYDSRLRENLIESGVRAILAVPMVREGQLIGCLVVSRNRPGEFPAETIELLRTFATQSALAIQNARLFAEIADKSRQLEAASRHKSEFLANMSHELRTPLNAVIGFSEVLLQRMFGELNAKQDEYLKDIYASGQHLLSLINDILDLSKIEAGRMELAAAPFHLPMALENAVTLVKERAGRHGIALQLDIDPRLGELVGDERKIKQVLLNLLSNAVKFTPEGGRIGLKARRTDGVVEIAVTDTGIGIAPEDQAAIFEEFRQVGSDETRKQEGTGLGLTLAKKFVELHGGRISVESEPGRGSIFTFTIPVPRGV